MPAHVACNGRRADGPGGKTMLGGYTAVIRQDEPWWIGWMKEVPGVNSQGATRQELIANLREALAEVIEMNTPDYFVPSRSSPDRLSRG